MLILDLSFLSLLITLWTSSIFEDNRSGKFSLIFTICLILETGAYTYNWLFWLLIFLAGILPFSLKNFDFSRTFLLGLSGISREILEISVLFSVVLESFFFSELSHTFFSINFADMYYQNNLLFWSVFNVSYSTL